MKSTELRQLIRESIQQYVREIEESGNRAACEAKINAIGEAIELREKKINKDGIAEEMHDMIDPKKIKQYEKEVKTLQKSLEKYKKQLDKMDGKSKEVTPEQNEEEEDNDIVDEVSLSENDPESGPELEEEECTQCKEEEQLYEQKLYMQKLAGIISETEYKIRLEEAKKKIKSTQKEKKEDIVKDMKKSKKFGKSKDEKAKTPTATTKLAKKKVLNEGEYSDWWAKADDELGLDFGDDIYSYVDSYDEPWQGKFADEVVNIDADDYEDFKNQVKQLYDEINPF